jgi:hypothetical protein
MTKDEHPLLRVELWYPRSKGAADTVDISLIDVRAADSIRISYDFDRDGWSIKQATVFEWDAEDDECDPCWVEVHFVQAWQFCDLGPT